MTRQKTDNRNDICKTRNIETYLKKNQFRKLYLKLVFLLSISINHNFFFMTIDDKHLSGS